MSANQVIRSTCGLCYAGCGILVHFKDGKVTKIEGDPESPINKGTICVKAQAGIEYLYSPQRLRHPLKRAGKRGEGKWQQISWDEALNIVAMELAEAKNSHGAESVAMLQGAAKGLQDSYQARFANVFGTPNIARQGHVCFVPRMLGTRLTCGFFPLCDYGYPPACIVVWGMNMKKTFIDENRKLTQALDRDVKLIVVDPRKTELSQRAELWLQLRPGSDLALALGMINVIVNEGLYDKTFVADWTIGFDQLRAHVQDYAPEEMEEITWVPAQAIREAARFYAKNKPACVLLGNAIDHNINSLQMGRAAAILRAITGNLGVPGGELQFSPLPFEGRRSPKLELTDKLSESKRQSRVGANLKLIPPFTDSVPQSIVRAILEEDPYPIRVVYCQGVNPLLTYTNAQETYKAFKKLDFLVVADMFMTPTAGLADIVLPVASFLEYDSIFHLADKDNTVVQVQQKVTEIEECWSDLKILNTLSKKLGLDSYFWNSEEEALNELLKPMGVTFKELRKIGVICQSKRYRTYKKGGFKTPSGKVELYSQQLKDWGSDPLPTYYELPETPYSNPELAKEYPLIFTSCKVAPFRHSGGRQVDTLRSTHPEPVVIIHPATAQKLGMAEGDWVYIETKRGRIKQKASLSTGIDMRVVVVDYAWWFPEEGSSSLYGWAKSNINILTDSKPPYSRELGSGNLRGILCKVYKT